tara:strand:+ start:520 stop:705 length:186 start_codon:yes stop_codon:yes gene_type:complete
MPRPKDHSDIRITLAPNYKAIVDEHAALKGKRVGVVIRELVETWCADERANAWLQSQREKG